MKIKFSEHAGIRLSFRKIPKKRVLLTIGSSDKTLSSFKGRAVFKKRFGLKVLEVVAKMEGDIMIVVTAYYLYENKIRQKS
ncbi:MAG: hypothetical protein UX13_C0049G0009 [Candidatus Woesebacteria bacterium GW2011_GWB1_45_5]|uniref:DUF4258 domain-containing protein n=1 Tax=Candidatus Woesebacteria bacterium GW2011_GWB1_45_5 TaxID=1618581 RepID=A0A0G1MLB5_9BACT|nr:MAG: hypothetical protein UX13_C0049G0009 [Candidatus Woesebacteria bacterium GW2011_GWB1_45_5]